MKKQTTLPVLLAIVSIGLIWTNNAGGQSSPKTTSPMPPFMDSAMEEQFYGMMKGMIKTMMDEQLSYFENPDVLKRMASTAKNYHEELVRAGFTEDQATQITASTSFLPTAMSQ